MAEAKKRKVTSADWNKVEKHIKDVYQARKTSNFRQNHERIWREVDRQVSMKAMEKLSANGRPMQNDWHSAIELGELSKASEIITSDVMRIMFPADRFWFKPHVELQWPMDEQTGRPTLDEKKQEMADGLLRSLMSQQHKDFGFKARFRLSVKESLHHGSFVAEARFDNEMMVKEGDKVRFFGAPVWVPYSMWNAYPDPSPSVIGTNMFYTGSMILVEYLPLWKLKKMATGEGWMQDRIKKIEKRSNKNKDDDTEDVELVKYKGDISIERGDGDIFLPNSEVILANDKLVYWKEADLPYPNVIFAGYERQDVRDPYYTSPIIKQSPIQKMTTTVANKFLDATALKVEPPIEYDSNDPDYAANGGPIIAPGTSTGTRSMGQGMRQLDIGDPRFALDAFTLGIRQMQEGLGVSALRAGVRESDRETATSANLANQGAEVRTMEFISQLEAQALMPFLYMQHDLNRDQMQEYSFYNDEMHTPDFIRARNNDIQANAHFEVVGSRGLLGEEQRARRLAETTAFFSSNPLFAPRLAVTEIMLETYRDAGKKNQEEWVKAEEGGPEIPPQVQQAMEQMQQAVQQLQQENQQLKQKTQVEMAKLDADNKQFIANLQKEREEFQKDFALRVAEFRLEAAQAAGQENRERMQSVVSINAGDEIGKVAQNLQQLATNQSDVLMQVVQKVSEIGNVSDAANKMLEAANEMSKPRRKMKVKRTQEGYEVE